MKIRVVLLFCFALVAAACGPDETPIATGGDGEIGAVVEDEPGPVADDSPPRVVPNRPDSSEVLAECGGERPDIAIAPAEGPADFLLTVRSDSVRRGDSFEFEWRIPDGKEITTGDEWLVECWTEFGWTVAWMAVDVFGYGSGPDYLYVDGDFSTTDDGFEDSVGTIVVPPDAPSGWYRLAERVGLSDAASSDLIFREAWFEVVS